MASSPSVASQSVAEASLPPSPVDLTPPEPEKPSRAATGSRLRRIVFWTHLVLGLGAGAVVLVMSVTGVLLMYERQILEWAEGSYRSAPPSPGAPRLSAEALLAVAGRERPGVTPTSLTVLADPDAPATVGLGRGRNLYLNPYSGAVLGEGAPKTRAFFRKVTDWHRWLGAGAESREAGKAVTGACNLAFLFLVVSGIYLWMPRRWTWRQVKSVLWFRGGLSAKARDFNWHNVIGFWMFLPLFFIVLSGVLISYRWAGDLLFRAVGEEPPAGRPEGPRGGGEPRAEAPSHDGLDELWARAETQVPGWQSLALRIPAEADAPAVFTIARSHRGRPDLRSTLTLNRQTGEVDKWEPFASQSLGRRLRTWGRWVHTGEAGGFAGQTLAGLASAGAAVLVWTGIALAWRRFFPKSPKLRSASPLRSDQGRGPFKESA